MRSFLFFRDFRFNVCCLCLVLSLFGLGCSRSERASRSLKRGGSLIQEGDRLLGTGETAKSKAAYEEAFRLIQKGRSLSAPGSMQEKTAVDLEKTAGYRKSAFDSPDGAVLSLMAALPQGDTPTTLLFVDADEVARRGLDEEAWAGLSAEEQSKWRDCVRAGVKTWTERDPAYFKLLQQVVDKVEVSGDLAKVISHASLLGATSEIELFCKKSNGVWKICDISMPAISLSLKQQVRDSLKGVSMMGLTLKEVLNRPDAEEILSKALLKVLEEGPQLESSLQGKSVTLIDGEGGVYEVIKQIEKEDGFWVLIRPEGGDPNALKWVQRSQTQEVQEEDEVWDLGGEASGTPLP